LKWWWTWARIELTLCSFLAGNGVPYAFTKELESGPVEANVSSPTAVTFGAVGAQHAFTDDYPAPNALVTFE
jgi:hypothetical protein